MSESIFNPVNHQGIHVPDRFTPPPVRNGKVIYPTCINNEWFYTIKELALIVNKGHCYIRNLTREGNRARKMSYKTILKTRMVYADELFDFPFAYVGRAPHEDLLSTIYHYNSEGNVVDKNVTKEVV